MTDLAHAIGLATEIRLDLNGRLLSARVTWLDGSESDETASALERWTADGNDLHAIHAGRVVPWTFRREFGPERIENAESGVIDAEPDTFDENRSSDAPEWMLLI